MAGIKAMQLGPWNSLVFRARKYGTNLHIKWLVLNHEKKTIFKYKFVI